MKIVSAILVGLVFVSGVCAQKVYNGGTTIAVTTGAVLKADTIINDGNIVNNGRIVVSGVWQNNADYDPGMGTMVLSGSQPQVVNHNDKSFTMLEISGGGEKVFAADLTIENELLLVDGVLRSQNDAQIFVNDGATISGGSASAYVEGEIVHTGTGRKYYPLGLNGSFLPLTLVDVTGSIPQISVRVVEPNPNLAVTGALQEVSSLRYWEVQTVAGTYDGSLVELGLSNESLNVSASMLVVAQSSDLSSPFTSLGRSGLTGDLTTGILTSELPTTLPLLAVGAVEGLAEISVFNAVSPNGDGRHDFLKIENITSYPDNLVIIYTKRGEKVFEMSGYDNVSNVFVGEANVGSFGSLPNGTYYYWIDRNDGAKPQTGFFVLNR